MIRALAFTVPKEMLSCSVLIATVVLFASSVFTGRLIGRGNNNNNTSMENIRKHLKIMANNYKFKDFFSAFFKNSYFGYT